MTRKRMSEMTQEEYKIGSIQKAISDFEFFKQTRGIDAALQLVLEYVYECAHNRGGYDERHVTK